MAQRNTTPKQRSWSEGEGSDRALFREGKPHCQVPSHRVATSNQPINRTSLHKKRSERLCHASVERAVDPNPVARPPRSADHSESMDAPSFTARQSGNKGRGGVHDSSWTGGNSLILKAVCRVDAVCFRSAW